MSSDAIISMSGVGKMYKIGTSRDQEITMVEQAMKRLRNPLRRDSTQSFWALQDIDLEIDRGEVVGIIGRNGAGKSTLLKILSRITSPTTGTIDLRGRVGSLLEVGTGFHPELTGRENIYLNGTILGMKKREIDLVFDSIVDFAGVAQFLETPVKRYSSGMYIRLAFAVAAHLRTEILVVDEVLAVGDAEFQQRCLGTMGDIAREGRTVLFVSHNLDSIRRLCARAALLHAGRLLSVGQTEDILAQYVQLAEAQGKRDLLDFNRPGSGEFRVVAAEASGSPYTCDGTKTLQFSVRREDIGLDRYYVAAQVLDAQRRVVANCDSRLSGIWSVVDEPEQSFALSINSPWLKPGDYSVDLFVCNNGIMDVVSPACTFEVLPDLPYDASATDDAISGVAVLSDFSYCRVMAS